MGWFLSYIYYIYLFVLGISGITLQFFLYLYKPPVFINDLSHLSQDLLRFNIRLFYLSNAPESSTSTNLILFFNLSNTQSNRIDYQRSSKDLSEIMLLSKYVFVPKFGQDHSLHVLPPLCYTITHHLPFHLSREVQFEIVKKV